MATVIGKVMAPVGKYVKNGEEKTRWLQCGILLETDNGLRLKIDAIPVGVEPGGLWMSIFGEDDKDRQRTENKPAAEAPNDPNLPF